MSWWGKLLILLGLRARPQENGGWFIISEEEAEATFRPKKEGQVSKVVGTRTRQSRAKIGR